MCRWSRYVAIAVLLPACAASKDDSGDTATEAVPSMPADGGTFPAEGNSLVDPFSPNVSWAAGLVVPPGQTTGGVVAGVGGSAKLYRGPLAADASPCWSWEAAEYRNVATGSFSTTGESAVFLSVPADDGSTIRLATTTAGGTVCSLSTPSPIVQLSEYLAVMPRFPTGDQNGDGDDDLLVSDWATVGIFNAPFTTVRTEPDAQISAHFGIDVGGGDTFALVGASATALLADANGDGFGDVVTAVQMEHTDPSSGEVTWYDQLVVVPGPVPAVVWLDEDLSIAIVPGAKSPSGAAQGVLRAGDFDGDGYADLLADSLYGWAIFPGPLTHSITFDDFGGLLNDSRTTGQIGSAGHFVGNDREQIYFGDAYAEWNDEAYGAVHVCDGPFIGEVSIADTCTVYAGLEPGDHAGDFVAPAHDTNGDGFDDLIVYFANDAGDEDVYTAHILLGG